MNPKQQTFVKEYLGGKSAGPAYAEAYDVPLDKSAYNGGSRLLANDDIKKTVEEVEREFPEKAAQAWQVLLNMLIDPKTQASVKKDIAFKLLALAGIQETQKVEQTTKIEYKGLNDDTNWIEEVLIGIKARKEDK